MIDRPFNAEELKMLGLNDVETTEGVMIPSIDGLEGLTPGFLLGDQYERVDELSQVLGGDDYVGSDNQQLSDAELAEVEEYLRGFFELL